MSEARSRLITEPCTQLGNAHRFVALWASGLRFCLAWDKWLVWDGRRWQIDETGEVERRAKETVEAMKNEVNKLKGASEDLVRHAKRSQTAYQIRAMIWLARTESQITVKPSQLDCDPYLLNCKNGTIDLRNGKLTDNRREDLITKLAPVSYDPDATCPEFEKFLERIMHDDAELITYLQRCFGYALTGDVTEKAVFILYGGGDNGKTTLAEAIRYVLGDYAGQIPIDSLMTKRSDGGVPNDIAALKGMRFVTSSEGEQGKKLAEAKLKLISGMGKLQARRLYEEYFEFDPTFKIFIDSNHKPDVRGTDNAIWNRLKLIPFEVSIPKEQQDKHLLDKLKTEGAGILAWLVRGCLEWQERGLGEPKAVKSASKAYRDEMDTLAEFIAGECATEAGLKATADSIYSAYGIWCESYGHELMSKKAVGLRLAEMGFSPGKVGGQRSWTGIALKSPTSQAA